MRGLSLSSRNEKFGVWPVWAAVLLGAFVLGALVSAVPAKLQLILVVAPLGAVLAGVVLARPEVGLAVLLFLAADVMYVNQAVDLRVLGGGLELRDTFLIFLWLVALLRYRGRRFASTLSFPIAKGLLVFLAFALFSAIWALARFGVDSFFVLRELRAVASYSAFFLVLLIVRDAKSFRFVLNFLTGLACFLALLTLMQYLVGASIAFAGGRVEIRRETWGLTRVLLPSVFLLNAMLVVTMARLVFSRHRNERLLLIAVAGLLAVSVALSQSRNLWLTDAGLLAVLFLISGGKKRWRLVLVLGLAGLLLVAGLVLLPSASDETSVLGGLGDRLLQPFREDLFESGRTLGGRVVEHQLAWEHIVQHPLLGIGLGNRYYDDGDQAWPYSEQTEFLPYFIHNGYAWIGLKMGIPALLVLLVLLLQVILVSIRNYRTLPARYAKGVAVGLVLCFTGICVSAVLVPIFMQPSNVVTLVSIVALIAAERRALA